MKLTELGYPVVNEDIHDRLFGMETPNQMTRLQIQKAKGLLKGFNISTPVDYPANLYDGPLPLPKLTGDNLGEHFENISNSKCMHY